MIKRFFLFFAIANMIFIMSACGQTSPQESPTNNTAEFSYNDSAENSTHPTAPSTEAVKLSDSCDIVLASGTANGSFYELVANQTDAYPNSYIEIGVIKNNTWLVPLSKESPFLDESGWWQTEHSELKYAKQSTAFVEGGYFLQEYARAPGVSTSEEIIYNPETGVSFETRNLQTNYSSFIPPYTDEAMQNLVFDGNLLAYNNNGGKLTLFNMESGKAEVINHCYNEKPTKLYGFNEGLYFARHQGFSGYCGLFNKEGKQVVNFLPYNVKDPLNEKGYLENGTITLVCYNENDIKFNITFDKDGNIVKQEKAS